MTRFIMAFYERALGVMASWHPWLIALASLVPFAGLLWPDGRAIPENPWINCDYQRFQLPIRRLARDEILRGRFPLWTPLLAAGAPLHAAQQGSLCHPVLTPVVLLFGADYGLKLSLFLGLASAWTGTYWLARQHEISRPASSLAAILVTWCGFSIGHLMSGHVTISAEYAVVPWFFLALAHVLRRPGPLGTSALSGLGACLALSGHPQLVYYVFVFGAFWMAGSLFFGEARRHRPNAIAWVLAAAVAAALLAAVQTLPSAELIGDGIAESRRAGASHVAEFSLDGLDVVRLIAPNMAGNPFVGTPPLDASDHYHERVVYLGLAAPLLALFGLSRHTARRWQWGLAAMSVAAFAIALAQSTPAFDFLSHVLPGLRLFRCQGRIFGVASVFIALLAARGLDSLIRGEAVSAGGNRLALGAIVWCAINLAGFAVLETTAPFDWQRVAKYARQQAADDSLIAAALALQTLAVLTLASGLGLSRRGLGYAIAILLAFIDMGWNNVRNFKLEMPSHPTINERLVSADLPRRFVQAPVNRTVSRAQLQYSRLVSAAVQSRQQLLGTDEGGVLPAATEQLFRAIEKNPRIALAVSGCDSCCSPDDGCCKSLDEPLPRARVVSDEVASIIDVPVEELVENDLVSLRDGMAGNVEIVHDAPREIVLDVDARLQGRLVLADTWYPGWTATIDDIPATIERAHGVFRSLHVPTGRHRIEFGYDPPSFRLGAVASLVGLVTWCGLTAAAFRRRWATSDLHEWRND